jgi:group II intron reverse transcriptase/maturase
MRDADTVLGIIQVRGEKRLPLEDVYRQLFNPTLYLKAYGKIYRNAGAMTKGMTDETADGMSLAKIESIIEEIRYERFRWTSVRRTYIPKKDGKQRPLGIPTWKDKLVQEVLRLILEAYYEPQFRDSSHGFRPAKGCHTALSNISINWKGTKWFIEGDIKGYFDNIDHEILLSILGANIHDNRFLELIKGLCRAGYCDDWAWHTTLSGVPQGGIISPILANIYLDRLDRFVEDELIPTYTNGTKRKGNPEYIALGTKIAKHRKEGDFDSANEATKLRRTIPSTMPDDPDYRRLRYIRYADDFLLGFVGTKVEATEIKDHLKTFLKEKLHLELSEGKTLITHAATEHARFLGYEIYAQHADDCITRNRRTINGKIGMLMPKTFVNEVCRAFMKDGKIVHQAERMNDSDFSIVSQYQSELRGYYQYYQMATNVSSLHKVRWVLETSLLKTLAMKHKTSVMSVVKSHKARTPTPHGEMTCIRVKVSRPNKDPLVATFGGIPLRRNQKAVIQDRAIHTFTQRSGRTELIKRLLAHECEVCGTEGPTEVHHIRALKDLTVPGRKEKPKWMKVMAARRRKTLVLCLGCHDDLHAGRPMKFRDKE